MGWDGMRNLHVRLKYRFLASVSARQVHPTTESNWLLQTSAGCLRRSLSARSRHRLAMYLSTDVWVTSPSIKGSTGNPVPPALLSQHQSTI